jgi:hypothetical protein
MRYGALSEKCEKDLAESQVFFYGSAAKSN